MCAHMCVCVCVCILLFSCVNNLFRHANIWVCGYTRRGRVIATGFCCSNLVFYFFFFFHWETFQLLKTAVYYFPPPPLKAWTITGARAAHIRVRSVRTPTHFPSREWNPNQRSNPLRSRPLLVPSSPSPHLTATATPGFPSAVWFPGRHAQSHKLFTLSNHSCPYRLYHASPTIFLPTSHPSS